MLALIGGLFTGVFGILGNIFSKKSDYLLEFDDAKGTGAPKQEPAKTQAEPGSVETPKAAAKKSENVGQQPQPTAPKAAPQPPVPNVKVSEKPEQLVLFAPNFLMPQPTGRRRSPGPSMSMFRSMAKDLNLPK